MAAYGSQIKQGKSAGGGARVRQAAARQHLGPGRQRARRADRRSRRQGRRPVAYENEAIQAQDAGEDVEYVVPDDTILIENAGRDHDRRLDAGAGVPRLPATPEAQQLCADDGYRPVDETVLAENKDKFPEPPGLFTIDDLGGWEKVNAEFFDPENGSVAEIESDLGVSTGVTPVSSWSPGGRTAARRPAGRLRRASAGAALARGVVTRG